MEVYSNFHTEQTALMLLKDSLSNEELTKRFVALKQKVDKTITNSEWSKKTKELASRNLEEGLNNDEKLYITRYKQYLYDDFMR